MILGKLIGVKSAMALYKYLIRPVLFIFPAEMIHNFVALFVGLYPKRRRKAKSVLATELAGMKLENPVGMAAGFDKDCVFFDKLYRFGFGAIEVGTITPEAQDGNQKPRIHRLSKDSAIVNRMGFPNKGCDAGLRKLKSSKRLRSCPIGVNVGANKDSIDRIADYRKMISAVKPFADYITVNVSSPNTPGLRTLERGSELRDLLDSIESSIVTAQVPVFLKVSPDLSDEQIEETCEVILRSRIAGVIVGNTTTSRPRTLKSKNCFEGVGGLSGAPLSPLSFQALRCFYFNLRGAIPIVSVGGISNASDAYARIRAGATAVQIYTSFIYEGPSVVDCINNELAEKLVADGFSSLTDAIGVDAVVQTTQARKTSSVDKVAEAMPLAIPMTA
jgi:dihydroorotate dehydrogenase